LTAPDPARLVRPAFTLRLDSELPVKEVARAVSAALSVDLAFDELGHGGSEIYGASALGIWVDVSAWPPWPVEGRFTYQLQGRPGPEIVYTDHDVLTDISAHVADALARGGAGAWYIPSDEQVLREMDLMEEWESDD
jgi:hypothetical protein